ncbi:MAG: hypothetical protein ACYCW6_10735 [Candidatus Xenobia bacterium]
MISLAMIAQLLILAAAVDRHSVAGRLDINSTLLVLFGCCLLGAAVAAWKERHRFSGLTAQPEETDIE